MSKTAMVWALVLLGVFKEDRANPWEQYRHHPVKTKSRPALITHHLHGEEHVVRVNNAVTLARCKHQICLYVDGYPEEEIDAAMEDERALRPMLGTVFNTSYDPAVESRWSLDEPSLSQLCATEGPTTYNPQLLRNSDNQWKVVVNTRRYQQTFTVETCRQSAEAQETSSHCKSLGFACIHNYQLLHLMIYENGKILFDKFYIPTTCRCCAASHQRIH